MSHAITLSPASLDQIRPLIAEASSLEFEVDDLADMALNQVECDVVLCCASSISTYATRLGKNLPGEDKPGNPHFLVYDLWTFSAECLCIARLLTAMGQWINEDHSDPEDALKGEAIRESFHGVAAKFSALGKAGHSVLFTQNA